MPDLSIAATDRPLRPDQYVYVETHAWWLTTHGPHQLLAEHRLRKWVPAEAEREWVLEREVTGAQEWLNGSAEEAVADGYDLRPAVPVGRFRARHGAFETLTDEVRRHRLRPAHRPRGSWQTPTREFFARLPRDPEVARPAAARGEHGQLVRPVRGRGDRPAHLPRARRPARGAVPGAGLPARRPGEEGVENVDGVACLALVHDAGRTRTELMLSPVDGQFAGERDTVRTGSRTGLAAGTVISSTAVHTAVVDEAGATPRLSPRVPQRRTGRLRTPSMHFAPRRRGAKNRKGCEVAARATAVLRRGARGVERGMRGARHGYRPLARTARACRRVTSV